MTGSAGSSCSFTSKPEQPGSITSSSTRSNRSAPAISSAQGPSKACAAVWPTSIRLRLTSSLMGRSSSAINIFAIKRHSFFSDPHYLSDLLESCNGRRRAGVPRGAAFSPAHNKNAARHIDARRCRFVAKSLQFRHSMPRIAMPTAATAITAYCAFDSFSLRKMRLHTRDMIQ